MAPKPKVPAAFAVITGTKAPKALAVEGRMEFMRRLRDLSGDGEKLATALMRVIETADKNSDVLKAIEIYCAYLYGKPVETSVSVSTTTHTGMGSLTSEQLMAAAAGKLPPAEVAEEEAVFSEVPSPYDASVPVHLPPSSQGPDGSSDP